VRALYTREIVQAGKKQGLKFDENWQEKETIAGPLPAQFLRETATYLEKSPVRLGLYLGSDYPINKVNQFDGIQLRMFNKIKHDRQDTMFDTGEATSVAYMSPDIAIAQACISCHNDHVDSPKSDWQLDDVMGATTWLYPTKTISLHEALHLLTELRQGFRFAYTYFIDEMKQLEKPPGISNKWPKQGYYVPAVNVFMQEASRQASAESLRKLMQLVQTSTIRNTRANK